MKHLIDKSALVAEIESKLHVLIACKENVHSTEKRVVLWAKIDECNEILSFLDTLEVKEEVTTDAFIEKAEKWLNEHILDYVYAKEWGQGVGVEGELFDDFKNAMKGE